MHIGKLTALGNSLAVVIPRHVLRELSWQQGDYIVVGVFEKEIFLQNVNRNDGKFKFVQRRRAEDRQAG